VTERVPLSDKVKEALSRSIKHGSGSTGRPRGSPSRIPVAEKKHALCQLVENRVTGRPTEYKPAYCDLVYKFRLLGLGEEKIADLLEISLSTFRFWREKYVDFLSAWRAGGEEADAKLVQSMYHRAMGYSHPAEKIQFDKDGNELRAEYTEYYPPDTAAGVFLLTNRQPQLWRRRDLPTGDPGELPGQITVRIIGGLPDAPPEKK
jgi:hypothetical protein